MAWTDASSDSPLYDAQSGATTWDGGATVWDVSGNIALTEWDDPTPSWSDSSATAATWSDA